VVYRFAEFGYRMVRFHFCFYGIHGRSKGSAKEWTATATAAAASFYSRISELGMKIDRPFDEIR